MLQCPQFKKHLNLETNKNCQYLKFLKSNCPNAFKSKIFNISTFLGSNCTDASNSIKYQKLVKQIVLLSAIQKKKEKEKKKKKEKITKQIIPMSPIQKISKQVLLILPTQNISKTHKTSCINF